MLAYKAARARAIAMIIEGNAMLRSRGTHTHPTHMQTRVKCRVTNTSEFVLLRGISQKLLFPFVPPFPSFSESLRSFLIGEMKWRSWKLRTILSMTSLSLYRYKTEDMRVCVKR